MLIEPAGLPGLAIITPRLHGDSRGWFTEVWSLRDLRAAGLPVPDIVQENHSFSADKGVLRGLHYQAPPHAQAKLVRCVRGAVRDIAVDVRRGSPHYGRWVAVELSDQNRRQLWIPTGFLHGFVTLTAQAEIIYSCSDYYAAGADGAVRWDSLGIDWGVGAPILSPRDESAPAFSDWVSPFDFVP